MSTHTYNHFLHMTVALGLDLFFCVNAFGHVQRMDQSRYPETGTPQRGGWDKERWIDTVKNDCIK